MMSMTLGIIGLGNAGSALALALSGRLPLMGCDANPERRAALGDLNLVWAESVAEVALGADKVLLSLPRPEISKSVVADLLAAGGRTSIIIETSTVTPKAAREMAETCRAAGVAFVDAAITGGVQALAAGSATFLVGGEEAAFRQAKPVLDMLARKIHHLGPAGAGSGMKIVHNGVMHALMVVLIEAGAMARKLDIPLKTFLEVLGRPDGIQRPLEHRFRERILENHYTGGMSVANAHKDSMLFLGTAQESGVPLFATLAAHTPYEIARQQGMEALDYASLAKLWEEWCHLDFAEK